MSPGDKTTVLLDPFPLWLDAVESVLSKNGVAVVGRTTERDQVLALVDELRPTVLVADPQTDGLSTIREACERVPGMKAIILSATSDPDHIVAAFAVGAVAYVLKTAHSEDVGVAVRQAFDRSVFVSTPADASTESHGSPPPAAQSDALPSEASRRAQLHDLLPPSEQPSAA
jgi:DNA-binding NarL/FixJ family response regulator